MTEPPELLFPQFLKDNRQAEHGGEMVALLTCTALSWLLEPTGRAQNSGGRGGGWNESGNPSQIPASETGGCVSSALKGSTAGFVSQPTGCYHPSLPNVQLPNWKPDGNWKKNKGTPKMTERVQTDCLLLPRGWPWHCHQGQRH